ncbi:MAG TPA: hypothetical protein VF322_03340 [Gammaproteobacteria bacterium]
MNNKLLLPLCLALCSLAALAQPPPGEPPQRLRGTLRAVDGDRLEVVTADDGVVDVRLAPEAGINGLERRGLDDITDGVFIGTTAARGADGRWKAIEVHIFPEEMRGAGEGHYAWDFPETTMTNATVTGAAAARDGRTLELRHAGGTEQVDVGPDTVIVRLTAGDRALLRPGAALFLLGFPRPDNTFDAIAVVAETDGVKPPM